MKPIIGIVGRVGSDDGYTTIYSSDSVRRCIIKKGGIPILIMPPNDKDLDKIDSREILELTESERYDLKKVIDLCDGIVMPGSYRLFNYDNFIYEYASNLDKPILGICAGMQLMGLMDTNLKLKQNDSFHFQKNVKYVHEVKIIKNTLLYQILKKDVIKVNSRHNYHIDKVNNLIISGISSDGLIEAVEAKNKKFILGVQWHPEVMLDYDDDSNKIIDSFINACSK